MSVKLLVADDEEVIRRGVAKYIRLHTDRFDKIYDYWKCKGDFGSCMTGRNRDEFYAYSVNAKRLYHRRT